MPLRTPILSGIVRPATAIPLSIVACGVFVSSHVRCGGEPPLPEDLYCTAKARGCGRGSTVPDCPVTFTATIPPSAKMSFFATSVGNGARGGDFGGIGGADRRCQCLAELAGAGGKTWRAYLSTSLNRVVHARDRIGSGPWFNYQGREIAKNIGQLHASGIDSTLIYTETGTTPPRREHDFLTGSDAAGAAFSAFPGNPQLPPPTCRDWTDGSRQVRGYVGHHDWNQPNSSGSWNSAHDTNGCSEDVLRTTLGAGRIYCFAID